MLGQISVPVAFIGGLLSGAAAVVLTMLWWRQRRPLLARVRFALAALLVTGFAIAAGVMYLAVSARSGGDGAGAAPANVAGATGSAPAAARSMELEVSALAARLARGGGTESDWTLLAQAYDFLARPEDAQRAEHGWHAHRHDHEETNRMVAQG